MFSLDSENKKLGYKSQKNNTLLSSLFVSCVENATCLVVSFSFFRCKLCPVVTKQRKWKTYTVPSIPGGPSCQSPYPPCTFCPLPIRVIVLIWRLQPDTRRFHTWLGRVTVLLQQGSGADKNHGGCLEVVFLPSPFKSTLTLAPNAPGPFSKAELWNPRSQAWSKTISPSEWANFHFTIWGQTGIWYVLLYLFNIQVVHFAICYCNVAPHTCDLSQYICLSVILSDTSYPPPDRY